MRAVGVVLVFVGLLWSLIAFNMNTTVSSGATTVNNIGLMDDRRNHLMFAGLSILAGVILIGFGSIHRQTQSTEGLRPCPFCAEPIQPTALKCRYCNSKLPVSFRAPPASIPLEPVVELPSTIVQVEESKSNFIPIIGTVCVVLGIGAILLAVSVASRKTVVSLSPSTSIPTEASISSTPLLEYPAPNDPRAKAILRACIDGKPYALEKSKWVPNAVIVGNAPLACTVQK